jgi:membrane protein
VTRPAYSQPSTRVGRTDSASGGKRTPLWVLAVGAALHFSGVSRTGRSVPSQRTGPSAAARPQSRNLGSDSSQKSSTDRKDDRGRGATSPAEIPAKGWKDIALRIYNGITEDRLLAIAAGVTFYLLLALFPAIAGLIALYGLYADAATMNQHLNAISGIVPEGGLQIIRDQVGRLTSQPAQRLGLATFVGLGVSLWSANGGMKAIFDALNVVYHEKEKRGFIRLNAVSLAFTLGAIVFALIAVAAIAVLPPLLSHFGSSRWVELLVKVGRWPVLLVGVSFAIALIYRFGPSRDKPQWRWISPGSVLAAVVWLAASLLFSWYTEKFGSYNETYGSLGAAIGFMTWLWISNIVILVGAKVNAETEHQTARDSTEGKPNPLGQRGAEMADTVGHASG